MIYSISILTSSGYPFYTKTIQKEPPNVNLTMRFYDYVHPIFISNETTEQSFELQAGLVSALYEFARLLGYPIELLKFKTIERESYSHVSTESSFISSSSKVIKEIDPNSDVIITIRSELFLIPMNVEQKVNLIYNKIIKKHLPLGPDHRITDAEEAFIVRILTDEDARKRILQQEDGLNLTCEEIIMEYGSYGLEGIIITSFDGTPLRTYKINDEETFLLLRSLGQLPSVKEFQWKYRMVKGKGLYIINSGCGVSIDSLFMPYYYILVTNENSFLGDSPTTIYMKINTILDED